MSDESKTWINKAWAASELTKKKKEPINVQRITKNAELPDIDKFKSIQVEVHKLRDNFKVMRDIAIIMCEEAEHRGGRFVVADKLVDREYKRRLRMRGK